MDLGTSIATCFRNYATFRGRASRAEYWWFALFSTLMSVAATIVDTAVDTAAISLLFDLALLLPQLAVAARRLHDRDRSGWWLLIGSIPLVGAIVLLIWFAQRGDPGDNRFGTDPLPSGTVAA